MQGDIGSGDNRARSTFNLLSDNKAVLRGMCACHEDMSMVNARVHSAELSYLGMCGLSPARIGRPPPHGIRWLAARCVSTNVLNGNIYRLTFSVNRSIRR
jgi:hypothetical protein